MTQPCTPDSELEERIAARLLDVLIRAGLILAMVLLCYRVFSPFLTPVSYTHLTLPTSDLV